MPDAVLSDPATTFAGMVFEVGMTVWRKGALGWEQARIAGQVFHHDCWYVTTVPGSTYVANGHQLRLDLAKPRGIPGR
jgi:hypothetical protein